MRTPIKLVCLTCLLLMNITTARADDPKYYSVEGVVAVDGQEIMRPQAIAVENIPVRVEISGRNGSYLFEYTISRGDGAASTQAAVHLSFFDKAFGNWVLRAQPSMIVRLGEKASVEMPYQEGEASPRRVAMDITITEKPKDELLAMFGGRIPDVSMCPSNTDASHRLLSAEPPTPGQPRYCDVTCSDGSGSTLHCCGAVKCCACGSCCSP